MKPENVEDLIFKPSMNLEVDIHGGQEKVRVYTEYNQIFRV